MRPSQKGKKRTDNVPMNIRLPQAVRDLLYQRHEMEGISLNRIAARYIQRGVLMDQLHENSRSRSVEDE